MFEEGQIKDIPLNTEIDVESADSFTPLQQPKLTHNRQKYQGGTLPSSVRFEHNGYACGWDVYNFVLESDPIEIIEGELYLKRFKRNDIGSYEFAFFKGESPLVIEELPVASFTMIKTSYLRNYSIARNVSLTDNDAAFTMTFEFEQIDKSIIYVTVNAVRNTATDDSNDLVFTVSAVDTEGFSISGLSIENAEDNHVIRSNTLDTTFIIKNMSQTFDIDIDHLCLPANIINRFNGNNNIFAILKECTRESATMSTITFSTKYTSNMVDILVTTIYGNDDTMSNSIEIKSVNGDLIDKVINSSNITQLAENMLYAIYDSNYFLQYYLSGSTYKYGYEVNNFTFDPPQITAAKGYNDALKTVQCFNSDISGDDGHYDKTSLLVTSLNNNSTETDNITIQNFDTKLYYNNDSDRSQILLNVTKDSVISANVTPQRYIQTGGIDNTSHVNISGASKITPAIVLNTSAGRVDIPLKGITMLDININALFRSDVRIDNQQTYSYFLSSMNVFKTTEAGSTWLNTGNNFLPNPYANDSNYRLFYYIDDFHSIAAFFKNGFSYVTTTITYTIDNGSSTSMQFNLKLDNMLADNDYKFLLTAIDGEFITINTALNNVLSALRNSLNDLTGTYFINGHTVKITAVSFGDSIKHVQVLNTTDISETYVNKEYYEAHLSWYLAAWDQEDHEYRRSYAIDAQSANIFVLFNTNTNARLFENNGLTDEYTFNSDFIIDYLELDQYGNKDGVFFPMLWDEDFKPYVMSDFNDYNTTPPYKNTFISEKTLNSNTSNFTIALARTAVANDNANILYLDENKDLVLNDSSIYFSCICPSYFTFYMRLKNKLNLNNVSPNDFEILNTSAHKLKINSVSVKDNRLSFVFDFYFNGKTSNYYIPSDYANKLDSDVQDKPIVFLPCTLYAVDKIPGIINKSDYSVMFIPLVGSEESVGGDNIYRYKMQSECAYHDTLYINSSNNLVQTIDTNGIEKNYNNNDLFLPATWNKLHNCTISLEKDAVTYDTSTGTLTGYFIYKVRFSYNTDSFDLYIRNNILSDYVSIYDMFNLYATYNDAETAVVNVLNNTANEVTPSESPVSFKITFTGNTEVNNTNLDNILLNMFIEAKASLNYTMYIPILESAYDKISSIQSYNADTLIYKYDNYLINFYIGNSVVACDELGYSNELDNTCFNTEQYSDNSISNVTYNIAKDIHEQVYQTATIQAYIRSITRKSDITIDMFSKDAIAATLDEFGPLLLDLEILYNPMIKNYLIEEYVDTTEETLTNRVVQKINTDDAYLFIKQFWNTSTDVENYWWLDSEHAVVLTKDTLDIYTKDTSEVDIYGNPKLDDWKGDKWKKSITHQRTTFIDSDCTAYFVTNCYKENNALLVTVQFNDDMSAYVHIYDLLQTPYTHRYFELRMSYKSIGSELNIDNNTLNTYSDISMRTLLSKSAITATVTNGKLLIGIHYDNNFNQWAIVYDLAGNSLSKIVQGYGYCSVKGEFTGGELPVKYFDINRGFNSTVKSIDTLDSKPRDVNNISEIYNINECVVGNDATQWYISNSLSEGIVNSINLSNDTFITLPLSNNYTVNYGSPSFSVFAVTDIGLCLKRLADLFPGENSTVWETLMVLFGYPILYYFAPKFTTLCYLQQSGGQAAYVHYNSNIAATVRHKENDGSINGTTLSNSSIESNAQYAFLQNNDSNIFDIQHLKQSLKTEYGASFSFLMLLLTSGVSAIKYGIDSTKLVPSEKQEGKQHLTFDPDGSSYSSVFSSNLEDLASTKFDLNSFIISKNSAVTFAKSLDMFYSTSNTQKVCAGPGYVNHNFVAQCVAQSFTMCQLGMSQYRIQYIISALTMYSIKIEYEILSAAAESADAIRASYSGSSFFVAGLASGTTWSTIVATIAAIIYSAAKVATITLGVAQELLPRLIDGMGGDHLQASITAYRDNAVNDFEAKHRYGSKSECFMYPCYTNNISINVTDESVKSTIENKPWKIDAPLSDSDEGIVYGDTVNTSRPALVTLNDIDGVEMLQKEMPYYIFKVQGIHKDVKLAKNIACIEGVSSFLPEAPYKNKTLGDSYPVFATPIIHDYIIDDDWKLTQTATGDNGIIWVSSNDTKLIDGAPSNIVITNDNCMLASPYCALEIKKSIDIRYLRPTLITPNALSLNISDYNIVHERRSYNAFDGVGYRIIKWIGSKAMLMNKHMMFYDFVANDRLKRFNKLPPLSVLGNFDSMPTIKAAFANEPDREVIKVINATDSVTPIEQVIVGEDISTRRYSIPIFTELVSTLPTQVKTIESYPLAVYDGITSLCTDIRNTQSKYKVPLSVDFNINKSLYRYTKEYICAVLQKNGVVVLDQLVPVEGLTFLGSTPYEAFFYSQSNRLYYTYTGGTALKAIDMIERFRNVALGRYDFIEQSVAMECLTDMSRIDSHIDDKHDETDNVFIANLKNSTFDGEVSPPNTTIFTEESWFKVYSLPSGIVFQGPNRCHIHRNIPSAYMFKQIKDNLGKWERVPREYFHPFRKYPEVFDTVTESLTKGVTGWTHNPFVLVTSMLGLDIHVDCKFEWEITFTWTDEMEAIYAANNYAVVNIMAETITQGGKVVCRPTHIYLTKDLFNINGDQGYYSFRFQSNNGIGNRERLFIWSDAYIALNDVLLNYKPMTQQRTSKLTQQVDVQQLSEL